MDNNFFYGAVIFTLLASFAAVVAFVVIMSKQATQNFTVTDREFSRAKYPADFNNTHMYPQ